MLLVASGLVEGAGALGLGGVVDMDAPKRARWLAGGRVTGFGVGERNSSTIGIVQLAMGAAGKLKGAEAGIRDARGALQLLAVIVACRRRVAFAVWLALLAFTLGTLCMGEDLPAAHVEIAAGFAGGSAH